MHDMEGGMGMVESKCSHKYLLSGLEFDYVTAREETG